MEDRKLKKRKFKMVENQNHSDAKLARMKEIVRQRLERQKQEEEEKRAAALRAEAVARGEAPPEEPEPEPEPEPEKPPEPDVPDEAAIAEMQEELEVIEAKKHKLFVKLKEMLKEEQLKKAAEE